LPEQKQELKQDATYHLFMVMSLRYDKIRDLLAGAEIRRNTFYISEDHNIEELMKERQAGNPYPICIFYNLQRYTVRIQDREDIWRVIIDTPFAQMSIESKKTIKPYDFIKILENIIIKYIDPNDPDDDDDDSNNDPEQPYSPSGIKIPREKEELVSV